MATWITWRSLTPRCCARTKRLASGCRWCCKRATFLGVILSRWRVCSSCSGLKEFGSTQSAWLPFSPAQGTENSRPRMRARTHQITAAWNPSNSFPSCFLSRHLSPVPPFQHSGWTPTRLKERQQWQIGSSMSLSGAWAVDARAPSRMTRPPFSCYRTGLPARSMKRSRCWLLVLPLSVCIIMVASFETIEAHCRCLCAHIKSLCEEQPRC